MSELELKITVRHGGEHHVSEMVRRLVTDGDANDGVALASEGYLLDVVKLERTDGLPLAIEEEFADWFSKSGIQSLYRDCSYKSYTAGRAVK